MSSRQLDEEAIFHVARQLEAQDARSTYLDQICVGDQALRERVERLLAVHEQKQEFLKSDDRLNPTVDQTGMIETAGQQIGRYKLLQRIGEGGMGVVFVAAQERPIRRKVALKVIKPGMDSKAVVARFEAERQALAMMDHPNIAKVLDAGTTESGRPYFAMEMVKGIPITEYCDRNRLTIRERLELFIHVCQAIQHAHQKGIIHRDIKPSNVLVTLHDGKPVPKVIDFGVAKAINARLSDKTIYTEHLQVVGTLLYMSPEQAELSGLDVDTRSDIYSLGVLLYELLTGTTPFQKEELDKAGFDEQRRIIRDKEPPRASVRISSLGETATAVADHRKTDVRKLHQLVRRDLDWIVLKAMEKDRRRRYETAAALADDVERHLDDEAVIARPPSRVYRLQRFAKRNKTVVISGVLIATSLLLALGVTGWGLVSVSRQASRLVKQKQTIAELYFRQILESVMSGSDDKARLAITEATGQHEEILERPKIEYLMGMRCLCDGRPQEARGHFRKSIAEDADWVLPYSALAMTFIHAGEAGSWEALEKAEQVAEGRKLKDLERVLFEQPRLILRSGLDESIAALTEIARKESVPFADAILADALMHKANDEGSWDAVQEALLCLKRARSYLPGNGYVLSIDLWTNLIAWSLATSEQEKGEYLRVAKEREKELRKFPSYAVAVNARVGFLEMIGDTETLTDIETSLADHDLLSAYIIAAAMYGHTSAFMKGNRFDAEQGFSDATTLMGKAWATAFTDGSDQEIINIYSGVKKLNRHKWWTYESLLLMQRDDDVRKRECQKQIEARQTAGNLTQWDRALLTYIRDDADDEATRARLLEVAQGQQRRCRESHAWMAFALRSLARGDRTQAEADLGNRVVNGYLVDVMWARAFLRRLMNDPDWPAVAHD